jgi:hypothetical protein
MDPVLAVRSIAQPSSSRTMGAVPEFEGRAHRGVALALGAGEYGVPVGAGE